MVGKTICKRRLNRKTCEWEETPEFFIDGKRVTKAKYERAMAKAKKPSGGAHWNGLGWKPVISDSLAVNPEQVQEFIDDAKKMGVPTDFQPTGEPIFTSTDHKRRYCKAYHMRERNAYY